MAVLGVLAPTAVAYFSNINPLLGASIGAIIAALGIDLDAFQKAKEANAVIVEQGELINHMQDALGEKG